MKKVQHVIMILMLVVSFSSCSKKTTTATAASAVATPTPTPTATATTNAIGEVYEKLKESAPSLSSDAGIRQITETRALSTLWDNSTKTFMGIGSTPSNPQEFVTDLLNPSAEQSLFERAKMPFLMACTLDTLGEKADNLLVEGEQTITIDDSVVDVCGTEEDFSSLNGMEITFTVENLTDDTYYDQKIIMGDMGGGDQWIFLRNTTTTLNLMHMESNTAGDEVSVMTLGYSKETETGAFQYFSKFPTDEKIFRIYMDSENDDIRLMAYKTNFTKAATVSLASKIETKDSMALSFSWNGQTAPYDTDVVDDNACIATADGSILEDESATCTDSDVTVLGSSEAATLISALSAFDESTIKTDAANSETLASKLPSFTRTTLFSADLGF